MVEERRRPTVPATMRFTGAIAIFVLGAGSVSATRPKLPNCESPIWSTEVFADLSRSRIDATRSPNSDHAGLTFLNAEELIVYEVDDHRGQTSSPTTFDVLNPFRLRLSVLDSASGKSGFSNEQQVKTADTAVFVTAGGVLVKSGGRMQLRSTDLAQERDVPFPLDRNSRFTLSVSASGRTIMLNEVIQDSAKQIHSHFEVLDAATLKLRYSWDQFPPLYHSYSISDQGIATLDFNSQSVVVSRFGSIRWDVAVSNSQQPGCLMISPTMVTNDTLVVQNCGVLLLQTGSGLPHSLGPFHTSDQCEPATATNRCVPYDGRMLDKTVIASEGRFVAIYLGKIRTIRHILTESSVCLDGVQVAVYDVKLRKRVLTVNVAPLPTSDYDVALSPDGSKLAILADRKVSVFAVPVLAK